MPRYDYQCDACGARYELHQSFSAETSHICEQCGKGTAKRKLSAPRIVFKGSGWYVTDSRNGSSATLEPPSPSSTSSSDSSAAPSASSSDSDA